MTVSILTGDCLDVLRGLPDASVQCCVTSPPYWGLRDYGHAGQLGLEPTPDEYVAGMVRVFAEVRRVLRDDGTCWVNLGDTYAAVADRLQRNALLIELNPEYADMARQRIVGDSPLFAEVS